ncbi:MAG TPA: LysR substrate-binding domain-containing protein, partial [Beijerinckiaceae bacterium]|nr:LysR substrate-binding domain-containing protein [Beijerinckiaceae bacterium]
TATSSTLSLIFRPDASSAHTDLSKIMRERLIVAPRGNTMRNVIQRSLALLPARPSSYLECPTCQTAAALVAGGMGPAIIHSICLQHMSGLNLSSIDLGPRFGTVPLVVMSRRQAMRGPLLKRLVNELVA